MARAAACCSHDVESAAVSSTLLIATAAVALVVGFEHRLHDPRGAVVRQHHRLADRHVLDLDGVGAQHVASAGDEHLQIRRRRQDDMIQDAVLAHERRRIGADRRLVDARLARPSADANPAAREKLSCAAALGATASAARARNQYRSRWNG